MRSIFSLIMATIVIVAAYAQSEPTKLVITMKDGAVATYQLADIDSISFEGETEQLPKAYRVVIPSDFSTGNVQKVMAGDKQVAEVCYEYIRSWKNGEGNVIDTPMAVVYPMNAEGKADLLNGIAANGAKISWDIEGDSIASYVPGAAAVTSVIVLEDGTFADDAADAEETQLEPYVIKDKRGLFDVQTYKVVKIGVQYWMASNLRAATFRDGTSIKKYLSTDADTWGSNTTGAYHVYSDDMNYSWANYGAMYNGYAVVSDKGLAPEGWEVSSKAQWDAMKKYLRTSQSSKVKSSELWASTPGNNKSGLTITPGGYFNGSMGDSYEGEDVYFWNCDKVKDTLFGTDALSTTRIKTSIATTGTHGYSFGHYVRCVRK